MKKPAQTDSTTTFEARQPFTVGAGGWAYDADGDRVLVCSLDFPGCGKLYAERKVESDGHFICEVCGRLGQRMVEATPERCGLVK